MSLHYTVICDNCGAQITDYAPRAAFVIKPHEMLKRLCGQHHWKKYKDGTVLCNMCATEFAGYQKDNAKWFNLAQKDRMERRPKTRSGATTTPEEYQKMKQLLKDAEIAEMDDRCRCLARDRIQKPEQLNLFEEATV